MAGSGKCEHSITPGWDETGEELVISCEKGSLSFGNAIYTRSGATKDTSVQLKLSFVGCNKLTALKLVTNARFVEVSVVKDSLLKYVATVRGTAPEVDSGYESEFPLFVGHFADDTCEFRELHLKFLSIKPAPVKDATQPMQLVVKSLLCEYTDGTPDTAPPLQQGPGAMSGMSGMSGMGGGGGVEMMAMMAMSMMGGGMGGGMSGGMGGKGGMPLPGMPARRSNPNPDPDPNLNPNPNPTPVLAQAETPTNRNQISNPAVRRAASSDGANSDVASSEDPSAKNNAACGDSVSSAAPHERAEPKINPTLSPYPAAAPAQAQASRPAQAPGLDGAQLAGIMWTVKTSMIDEIGQLLDRKLAPVMARLDGIDAKLRTLETQVRARQDAEIVAETTFDDEFPEKDT